MTASSVYLLHNSSWKCHQLAAEQLLAEQLLPGQTTRPGNGKAGGTATDRPSQNKSHLPGYCPPAKLGRTPWLGQPSMLMPAPCARAGAAQLLSTPEVGDLDEPDLAKPSRLSSRTGPPGYIGWTRFQPVDWRACTATQPSGLADCKVRLKLPPQLWLLAICSCSNSHCGYWLERQNRPNHLPGSRQI